MDMQMEEALKCFKQSASASRFTTLSPTSQRERNNCRRGPLYAESGRTVSSPTHKREAAQLAWHRMTVYRKQRDGRWFLFREVHTLSAVAYKTQLVTDGAAGFPLIWERQTRPICARA